MAALDWIGVGLKERLDPPRSFLLFPGRNTLGRLATGANASDLDAPDVSFATSEEDWMKAQHAEIEIPLASTYTEDDDVYLVQTETSLRSLECSRPDLASKLRDSGFDAEAKYAELRVDRGNIVVMNTSVGSNSCTVLCPNVEVATRVIQLLESGEPSAVQIQKQAEGARVCPPGREVILRPGRCLVLGKAICRFRLLPEDVRNYSVSDLMNLPLPRFQGGAEHVDHSTSEQTTQEMTDATQDLGSRNYSKMEVTGTIPQRTFEREAASGNTHYGTLICGTATLVLEDQLPPTQSVDDESTCQDKPPHEWYQGPDEGAREKAESEGRESWIDPVLLQTKRRAATLERTIDSVSMRRDSNVDRVLSPLNELDGDKTLPLVDRTEVMVADPTLVIADTQLITDVTQKLGRTQVLEHSPADSNDNVEPTVVLGATTQVIMEATQVLPDVDKDSARTSTTTNSSEGSRGSIPYTPTQVLSEPDAPQSDSNNAYLTTTQILSDNMNPADPSRIRSQQLGISSLELELESESSSEFSKWNRVSGTPDDQGTAILAAECMQVVARSSDVDSWDNLERLGIVFDDTQETPGHTRGHPNLLRDSSSGSLLEELPEALSLPSVDLLGNSADALCSLISNEASTGTEDSKSGRCDNDESAAEATNTNGCNDISSTAPSPTSIHTRKGAQNEAQVAKAPLKKPSRQPNRRAASRRIIKDEPNMNEEESDSDDHTSTTTTNESSSDGSDSPAISSRSKGRLLGGGGGGVTTRRRRIIEATQSSLDDTISLSNSDSQSENQHISVAAFTSTTVDDPTPLGRKRPTRRRVNGVTSTLAEEPLPDPDDPGLDSTKRVLTDDASSSLGRVSPQMSDETKEIDTQPPVSTVISRAAVSDGASTSASVCIALSASSRIMVTGIAFGSSRYNMTLDSIGKRLEKINGSYLVTDFPTIRPSQSNYKATDSCGPFRVITATAPSDAHQLILCDFLVTDQPKRTLKFLAALATAKAVLRPEWLVNCVKDISDGEEPQQMSRASRSGRGGRRAGPTASAAGMTQNLLSIEGYEVEADSTAQALLGGKELKHLLQRNRYWTSIRQGSSTTLGRGWLDEFHIVLTPNSVQSCPLLPKFTTDEIKAAVDPATARPPWDQLCVVLLAHGASAVSVVAPSGAISPRSHPTVDYKDVDVDTHPHKVVVIATEKELYDANTVAALRYFVEHELGLAPNRSVPVYQSDLLMASCMQMQWDTSIQPLRPSLWDVHPVTGLYRPTVPFKKKGK